ncbi:MarR family winged helix-turn-helix transcriptional regulator [Paenarthrobacter nicotinovorans]|uniref:MarR family winged helix-turn-helix transcriptional regulator n=1 Tax=Paenarthrobacter nicotinovorans TaxID=29320 RepID=UPI003823674F
MLEQQSPTLSDLTGDLDYWSFVDLAQKRLDEEFYDNDARATRVVLSLSRAASQVVYDLESSIHRPRGWSWAAFRLMFVLWLAGPMESSKAAHLAGMSRAAVSNLTNSMLTNGYLSKEAATQDRRSVTISITEVGREKIREAFLEHNAREAMWANTLTEVEQDLLVMLLRKLMSTRGSVSAKSRS